MDSEAGTKTLILLMSSIQVFSIQEYPDMFSIQEYSDTYPDIHEYS